MMCLYHHTIFFMFLLWLLTLYAVNMSSMASASLALPSALCHDEFCWPTAFSTAAAPAVKMALMLALDGYSMLRTRITPATIRHSNITNTVTGWVWIFSHSIWSVIRDCPQCFPWANTSQGDHDKFCVIIVYKCWLDTLITCHAAMVYKYCLETPITFRFIIVDKQTLTGNTNYSLSRMLLSTRSIMLLIFTGRKRPKRCKLIIQNIHRLLIIQKFPRSWSFKY